MELLELVINAGNLTHNERVAVERAERTGRNDVDFNRYLGKLQAQGVDYAPYVPGEALARWEASK